MDTRRGAMSPAFSGELPAHGGFAHERWRPKQHRPRANSSGKNGLHQAPLLHDRRPLFFCFPGRAGRFAHRPTAAIADVIRDCPGRSCDQAKAARERQRRLISHRTGLTSMLLFALFLSSAFPRHCPARTIFSQDSIFPLSHSPSIYSRYAAECLGIDGKAPLFEVFFFCRIEARG